MASSSTVKRASGRQRARSASGLPRASESGRSRETPMAVRRKTRLAGVNSRTATRMSR